MAFNFVAGKKQKVIISQNCFSFLFTIKIPHKPDSRLKWFPELLSNPGDVSMATGGGSATLWVWLERCNVLLLFYGSGVSKPHGEPEEPAWGKFLLGISPGKEAAAPASHSHPWQAVQALALSMDYSNNYLSWIPSRKNREAHPACLTLPTLDHG